MQLSCINCFENKSYSPLLQFFLLFTLLMFLNIDSWFAPVFWDDIIGLHTQAVWLARNNFDLPRLISSPRTPGTPFYNLLSPLGYIYALFYRFTTVETTHFLAHAVNIASVAGCGVLLFNMLKKMAFLFRLLLVGAALSSPLAVSACAGTAQEAPLAFLLFLSLYFKFGKHEKGAWGVSAVSWSFKLTGALLTLSYLIDDLYSSVRKRKLSFKKCVLLLLTVAAGIGYYLWHFTTVADHFAWKPEAVKGLILNAYWSLIPLFILAVFFSGRRIFSEKLRLLILFILLFLGANFFSSMTALPRYGVVIVFPVLYLFALALNRFPFRLRLLAAAVVTVVHLCNLYGTFLPKPAVLHIHDGAFRERSREFTLMRSRDLEFCRILEKEQGANAIVCTWPLLQMLTVPEFGYVTKPLPKVYAAEYPHPLGNFERLKKEHLKEDPLFIYAPNCYSWQIPRNAQIVFASAPQAPLRGYIIYRLRR